MMGQLPTLETRKAVDEPHQRVAVERAHQNAAGFFCSNQVRKGYHIEFRNTPDFLLQIFDGAHLRNFTDFTYLYSGDLRSRSHAHFTSTRSAMYDACLPARNTF